MNDQQLFLQKFKSAETGIIELVGAQVSLDNFKTRDCLARIGGWSFISVLISVTILFAVDTFL